MNKAWLVSLLITAVALSGCTSDDGGDETVDEFREEFETQSTESQEEPGDGETGSGPSETSGENETSPGIIEVTLTPDITTGAAPLTVQFTINATAVGAGGASAEADFEWALFSQNETDGIEESGNGLPATVNQTFETAGNYTLIAGVSAEGFEDGFANVTLTVTEAEVLPSEETWYLHLDECGDGSSWVDKKNSPDAGGCGSIPANPMGERLYDYEGRQESIGHAAGTPMDGELYVRMAYSADQNYCALAAKLTFTVYADGTTVATVVNELAAGVATSGYVAYPLATTLDAEIPADAILSASLDVEGATCAYVRHETPENSHFIIG